MKNKRLKIQNVFLSIILVVCFCVVLYSDKVLAVRVLRDSGTIGNITYTFDESSGTLTISGNGNGEIESKTFERVRTIKNVIIQDGIINIGDNAFCDCFNLTSVTISQNVTKIGMEAFYGCNKLTSVTMQEGVKSIGNSAFYNCSELVSIGFPQSLESIGDNAFYGCNKLTSVTMQEGIKSIGDSAFDFCRSITSIIIPEGVETVGVSAFAGCESLANVTIPSSLKSISSAMFHRCSSLTNVTIPEGVNSIGDYAFEFCDLTSITIPSSVTSIGKYAIDSKTICCEKGSTAEKYAKGQHDINIVYLNSNNDITNFNIKKGKTYKKSQKIKISDEDGIKSIKLNGKAIKVKSGVKSFSFKLSKYKKYLKKKKKYNTLVVVDILGEKSTIKFKVK